MSAINSTGDLLEAFGDNIPDAPIITKNAKVVKVKKVAAQSAILSLVAPPINDVTITTLSTETAQDNFIVEKPEKQEIITDKKTGSPGSPCELTGLTGSPARSSVMQTGLVDDAELPTLSNQESGDYPEKESKLAEQIANTLRDLLCYDEIAGDWYGQKKGLWYVISEKKALKIIMKALDIQMPEGYAINKLNNIKTFLTIYLLLDEWEQCSYLLPMKNGVLNIRTMRLMEHSHKNRFNWQLPYAFNPDAKIDIVRRWLWDASGQDKESVSIIRAFFKLALLGGDVQKFLELIGLGGTGKSTLTRLLVAFIGEKNHTVTDLKNLETNRFECASLYGKRLAIINDSSRYGGEVAVLKAATGGDPLRLEKKNQQQSGSFVYKGVIAIVSNEPIQTADYTSGLIRRRMPVNFNRKVTDADKEKWRHVGGIENAMQAELPGILNWVLSMSNDEVKSVVGGINGTMTQVQREHLVETHKIAAWLDDNTVIKTDAITYVGASMKKERDEDKVIKARTEKLYANYEAWCDEGAVHPVALQKFTANLVDVCDQLKIDVVAKAKDKFGKPVKGITIRRDYHDSYATPVTKRMLGDEDIPSGDPVVTQQTPYSSHGDLESNKLLSVTIPLNNNDTERF